MRKRMWISKRQHPTNVKNEPFKAEQMCDNRNAPDFLVEKLRSQNVMNTADLYRIVEESMGETENEVEEPTLVDLDDDGNEVRSKAADSAWRRPSGEFAEEAFIACHIKQWSTKKQKARWNKVMTEMRSVYGEELKIRRAWVQTIIAWAKRKNEGRYAVAITMDNLISAMDNSGYEAFKKEYLEKRREE